MVGCGRATQVWFSAIIIIYFVSVVRSCFIAGYDSGKCAETSEFDDQMTFCGEFIKYRACIPLTNTELFPNHTVRGKDDWIRKTYKAIVQNRIDIETNETLQQRGLDEGGYRGAPGYRGSPTVRFYPGGGAKEYPWANDNEDWFYNNDCLRAFKAYFCYINFPRCSDLGKSLVMCASACENLARSCKYFTDMIRCGESKYHNAGDSEGKSVRLWDRLNGNSPAEDPLTQYPDRPLEQQDPWAEYPEVPPYRNIWGSNEDGQPYYRRDWQIGQPFRTNQFKDWPWNEHPRVICTPSLANGAEGTKATLRVLWPLVVTSLLWIFS